VRSIGGDKEAEDVRDGARALQQRQRAVRVRAVEHAVPPLHHHFARNLLVRFHLPKNILDDVSDVAVGIRHVADVAGAQLLQSAHEDEARVQLNGKVSQTSRARRFNARHMVLDAGDGVCSVGEPRKNDGRDDAEHVGQGLHGAQALSDSGVAATMTRPVAGLTHLQHTR
jgi:hypothetical protein